MFVYVSPGRATQPISPMHEPQPDPEGPGLPGQQTEAQNPEALLTSLWPGPPKKPTPG